MRQSISTGLNKAFTMSIRRITRSSSKTSLKTISPKPNEAGVEDELQTVANIINNATTNGISNGSIKRKSKAMAPPATPPAKKVKQAISTPSPTKNKAARSTSTNLATTGDRPAEPHMTNAPLLTPHGSRIVTYTEATADVSPSKSGIPRATTTTGHILEEACAHLLKIEPKFEPFIKQYSCEVFSAEGLAKEIDPFNSLASGIISQQVSGAAAASIKKKFVGLFNDSSVAIETTDHEFPSPQAVAKAEIPFLRTAGLSERKAEYIKGLAEKFASGELTARWLIEAPYDEMVEKLVSVRGLGKWSVEMFACFSLKRMDVFSLGDLGIQRGVGVMLGRDVKKLKAKGGKWKYATEREMVEFAEPFSPYRSLLMWYLWKASDTAVGTMQD